MKIHLSCVFFICMLVYTTSCHSRLDGEQPIPDTNVIPVKMVAVHISRYASEIDATGLVTTDHEIKYAFKIGGVIESIFVEEGQFFAKGKLLATLNKTEIGAGLEQAGLNVEKAERDWVRAVNLYKDSVYTLEQMQDAKTRLDLAKKSRIPIAFNEQYSSIYAAGDGFVNKKLVNTGEIITAGTPVLAINETRGSSDYILKVGVTDKEWMLIEPGQTAAVTLDGFPGDTIPSTVFRKSQAAENADGSYQVELKLKLGKLKPAIGQFGKARISTKRLSTNTVIPYEALIEADGDKAFVFTSTPEGRVRKIPITIASFNNEAVFVKTGLENIQQVIVSNSAFLNGQSRIKLIK